jgi:hypothetical protein
MEHLLTYLRQTEHPVSVSNQKQHEGSIHTILCFRIQVYSFLYVWLCMIMYDYVCMYVCKIMYVWVCMSMYEYVWVCVSMDVFVGVCISMYEYVWVCMGVYEHVW